MTESRAKVKDDGGKWTKWIVDNKLELTNVMRFSSRRSVSTHVRISSFYGKLLNYVLQGNGWMHYLPKVHFLVAIIQKHQHTVGK